MNEIDRIAQTITEDPDVMLEWDPNPRPANGGGGLQHQTLDKMGKPMPAARRPTAPMPAAQEAPVLEPKRRPMTRPMAPAPSMAPPMPPTQPSTPAPAARRPTEQAPVLGRAPKGNVGQANMGDYMGGMAESDNRIIQAIADSLTDDPDDGMYADFNVQTPSPSQRTGRSDLQG